jgi:ankyrin repeat protein
MAAALKGNGRIVEQLLSRGGDPSVVDATGRAAISYAAVRGFREVVRQLLDAGVDADAASGHGLTPLMWAAGHGEDVGVRSAESVVALLLDRGAQLDLTDDRGRTALMVATELGHVELVEMLAGRRAPLDLAANPHIRQIITPPRPEFTAPSDGR